MYTTAIMFAPNRRMGRRIDHIPSQIGKVNSPTPVRENPTIICCELIGDVFERIFGGIFRARRLPSIKLAIVGTRAEPEESV